jgi:hypothetical protein
LFINPKRAILRVMASSQGTPSKGDRSRMAALLGKQGGKARMKNLTKAERRELSMAGVRARKKIQKLVRP